MQYHIGGSMDLSKIITPSLRWLESEFVARGYKLWLVGGVARDLLRGVVPKDVDLCADATPEQQVAIYKELGVRFIETGLQHGTITVVLDDEPYEITSLRVESNHDGRHADVEYTTDLLADLGRRDLTINAIALTFEGDIIDPFGGVEDLKNNVVRFVGTADDRMQEDYLRILRWFRFHGRIAGERDMDAATKEAVQRNAHGLRGISRERVWMEMSKIITGKAGAKMVQTMYELGVTEFIDLPDPIHNDREVWGMRMVAKVTKDPVTVMCALLGGYDAAQMAAKWKWSAEERDLAQFLAKHDPLVDGNYTRLLTDRQPRDSVEVRRYYVSELARLTGNGVLGDQIMTDPIPEWPVTGQDLIDAGMRPGREVGETHRRLIAAWIDSRWTLTKDQLLAMV